MFSHRGELVDQGVFTDATGGDELLQLGGGGAQGLGVADPRTRAHRQIIANHFSMARDRHRRVGFQIHRKLLAKFAGADMRCGHG